MAKLSEADRRVLENVLELIDSVETALASPDLSEIERRRVLQQILAIAQLDIVGVLS